MTLGYCIQSAASLLSSGKSDSGRLDGELLLSRVLDRDRLYLYTHWAQKLSEKQIKKFQSLLKMRATGMPMAYILGKKEFYGYEFRVEQGVFIPRPETETLVSSALSGRDRQKKWHIMDLGCGSGCIGLSLLAFLPKARLIAVDFNEKALKVSERNAKNRGFSSRTVFLGQDILKWNRELSAESKVHNFFSLKKIKGKMDLIVANPPYIAFDDNRVNKKVVSFEPPSALFSGERGLQHISSWLNVASHLLRPGGDYFFEIGAQQDISALKGQWAGLRKIAEFRDLSGIIRVIQFQKQQKK